jgi:Family of unknown function (DUF5706)
MADIKERLLIAQWVFERHLGWIAAAEVKVGVIVAINTAMLGGIAAAFSSGPTRSHWALVVTIIAVIFGGSGLFCAAMAVLPRLTGPAKSLLFFGKVAMLETTDYTNKFRTATDEELLADWTAQIHRNAEIAISKHGWVRKAMMWSFISCLPWTCAILLLVKV